LGGADDNFELRDVYRALDELMETLRALEARGGIRLSPDIRNAPADDVMADALRHFSIYHQKHAIYRKGDRLFIGDRSLLFYYQNRLEGYDLEARLGLKPALAPSHRHILGAA
jgi:glycerol-3-phosphate O-acyltransferase